MDFRGFSCFFRVLGGSISWIFVDFRVFFVFLGVSISWIFADFRVFLGPFHGLHRFF